MDLFSNLNRQNSVRCFKKAVFAPLILSGLLLILTACSGSIPELTTGVAPDTKSANFGQPASPQAIASAAKELGSYFNGQHANNPEKLMGAPASPANTGANGVTAQPMLATYAAANPVYRFYNTHTSTHFYTMSASERDYVQTTFPQFNFEGISFYAYPSTDPALSPVYRFFNKVSGTHFYTINASEKDHVIATWPHIFNFEGISWYASATNQASWIPVYRFFNTKTGTHFYTTNAGERDHVIATWSWFNFEGIAYYVRGTAVIPDTTAPIITVLGTNPLTLPAGTAYSEAGATCTDDKDTTCSVVTTGTVNTATAGSYTITYSATDAAGNTSSKTRAVTVAACTAAANGSTGYSLVFKGCDAANVAEYYDKTECVRQNATGLIWQGQMPAKIGSLGHLRANNQYKTNYDSTIALQKWNGSAYVAPTQAEIDTSNNSIGFKNAVNASNLCGSGAWRLPTREELSGIVKINSEAPMIDTDWFPNTGDRTYWSSSPHVGNAGFAWGFYFDVGYVYVNGRGNALPVRLVRASQ